MMEWKSLVDRSDVGQNSRQRAKSVEGSELIACW